jgi:hypothetical protein
MCASKKKRAGNPALLRVLVCSLSDWPTSWEGTLRRIAKAVNGFFYANDKKKPRLFKGAAS